jgi:hypothetical protein
LLPLHVAVSAAAWLVQAERASPTQECIAEQQQLLLLLLLLLGLANLTPQPQPADVHR